LMMDCDEPEMREDPVTVGQGSADLRYRPYFYRWAVDVTCVLDVEVMTVKSLIILVNRAGFGIGIGEWRPDSKKGGDHGRFEIDTTHKIEEKNP